MYPSRYNACWSWWPEGILPFWGNYDQGKQEAHATKCFVTLFALFYSVMAFCVQGKIQQLQYNAAWCTPAIVHFVVFIPTETYCPTATWDCNKRQCKRERIHINLLGYQEEERIQFWKIIACFCSSQTWTTYLVEDSWHQFYLKYKV